MEFVKEDIIAYIKRIVVEHNNDEKNRQITKVVLDPEEWTEVRKELCASLGGKSCPLKVPLRSLTRPSSGACPEGYQIIELVRGSVKTAYAGFPDTKP